MSRKEGLLCGSGDLLALVEEMLTPKGWGKRVRRFPPQHRGRADQSPLGYGGHGLGRPDSIRWQGDLGIETGCFAQDLDFIRAFPRQIEVIASEMSINRDGAVDRAAQV